MLDLPDRDRRPRWCGVIDCCEVHRHVHPAKSALSRPSHGSHRPYDARLGGLVAHRRAAQVRPAEAHRRRRPDDRGGRARGAPPPGRNRGTAGPRARLHPLGVVASAARLQGAHLERLLVHLQQRDRRAPAALDAAAARAALGVAAAGGPLRRRLFVRRRPQGGVHGVAGVPQEGVAPRARRARLPLRRRLAERGARRALGIPGGLLAHLARPLRPAVFCVRSRLVRRLAVDCLACLRTLGRLGALLLPLLLFFATLAVRLFRGSAAHAQLGSLAAALRSLSILLTTTNLPEISDAVLGVSRAHGAFVVAFVVSGSFLLMNLALPLIYQSYCASHLKQDEKERRKAREGLGKAFSALLLPDHTALPVATVVRLLRRLDPGITRLRVAAIVQTLSPQQQPGGGTSPPQPRAASPYRRPLADPPPPARRAGARRRRERRRLPPTRAADGPPAAPTLPRRRRGASRSRAAAPSGTCGSISPRPPRPRGGGSSPSSPTSTARRSSRPSSAAAGWAYRRWTHCWRRGRRWRSRCSAGC